MEGRGNTSISLTSSHWTVAKCSSVYRWTGDNYGAQLQLSSEYVALMATQNPLLPVGQWVQYNVSVQSPRAELPSVAEQTIGSIRQAFTAQGKTFYQVVWNPGDANPETGLYTDDQLCALTQQQATAIRQQIACGTYQPNMSGTPGADYQQPNIPVQAAPPQDQPTGEYSL